MQTPFSDKNRNPLESGVLYDIPPLSWPLFFQGYEYRLEGDFKKLEAVFHDFRGDSHYFNHHQIATLATQTTTKRIKEYITSANSLTGWLLIQESKIAQRQAKCTARVEIEGCPVFEAHSRATK